jgi:hypothetical protein
MHLVPVDVGGPGVGIVWRFVKDVFEEEGFFEEVAIVLDEKARGRERGQVPGFVVDKAAGGENRACECFGDMLDVEWPYKLIGECRGVYVRKAV